MRYYLILCFFAPVLLLTTVGLPALCCAQGIAGSLDFRERSSYSAEDLAQALFPKETPAARVRSIGPPQALPSLPIPRPAVTLNVPFGSNSETVPSTSYAEIDKLGTVLSWPQYTDYRVRLEGHTDSLGSQRKNQVLSEKRVQSIKDYLIQRFHIAPERVQAVGYGMSRPLASNDTPEGRSQNRRVEVVNLGRQQ